MADPQAAEKLYTLTEVAKKTKISMPTLQRYKKLYQDRIPSQGKGRSQRYPEEALDVFRQLKKENISRRGRPRKNASTKGRPAAKRGRKPAAEKAAAPKSGEGLLTLTQIGQMTGISYPTLLRYTKSNLPQIPHKGSGRARRYHPEAVAVFKDLRSKSKRGRKAGTPTAAAKSTGGGRRGRPPKSAAAGSGDLSARVAELEKTNKRLVRDLGKIEKKLGSLRIVMR
jgi:DNA-binding transcriptional MerR regulator